MSFWRDYARRALERPFDMTSIFLAQLAPEGHSRHQFVPQETCLDVALRWHDEWPTSRLSFGSWFWPPEACALDMTEMLGRHVDAAFAGSET